MEELHSSSKRSAFTLLPFRNPERPLSRRHVRTAEVLLRHYARWLKTGDVRNLPALAFDSQQTGQEVDTREEAK
jgi:hypothetical protein